MITPLFEVSQDDEFVILVIRVPYMKASTFDYYIIGTEFKFYAKPYFLRLNFPHPLDEESGRERLAYDISNGVLTVHLPKATRGQFFENLGMITQLLAKKKPTVSTAPVQVVSSTEEGERLEGEEEFDEEEEEEIDMEIEQMPAPEVEMIKGVRYGFNNQYSGFFSQIQEEISEIVELPNPDSTPASARKELRQMQEDARFDTEHYMADFMLDETIQELIRYEPHWVHERRKYKELKREYLSHKPAKEETSPKEEEVSEESEENNQGGPSEESNPPTRVEKLPDDMIASGPRIIMLKTNKEKEEEERRKERLEPTDGEASSLRPFPFGHAGSRSLVQEIGSDYRRSGITRRPLIQEISSTTTTDKEGDSDEDDPIDVASEMRPVSTKRSTDKPQSGPSTTGGPMQLQIQPKSSTPSLPSGFILSSSSSSEESGSAAPSLVVEVDDQSTVHVDKQPSNPLPDEVTKASAPTPAPFTSISFEVENSHLLQTGNPFPFSPQSSLLPSSSSSSGLPFVFSSPSSSGNQTASTKFPASPSTPVASTTTSSSRASEPPKQSFTLKARKEDKGKSPVSKVRKTRTAKSKEELKEEMKMKISIEDKVIEWTQDEKETMLRLPRKEYILENEKVVLLGLVDLVFAYAYNQRTTMDEPTCESDWTITFISPTLSWLDSFGGIHQTLTACVRRSLAYPLYRHWQLSETVLKDVVTIFSLGKRSVLRALLGIKRILDRSDPRFYHCKLYIDDYCVWLQSYSNHRIHSLHDKLREAVELFDKEDVGWDLDQLERDAPQALMEVESDEGEQERAGPCDW